MLGKFKTATCPALDELQNEIPTVTCELPHALGRLYIYAPVSENLRNRSSATEVCIDQTDNDVFMKATQCFKQRQSKKNITKVAEPMLVKEPFWAKPTSVAQAIKRKQEV